VVNTSGAAHSGISHVGHQHTATRSYSPSVNGVR
jgi:hypothetical protein